MGISRFVGLMQHLHDQCLGFREYGMRGEEMPNGQERSEIYIYDLAV